MRDREFKTTMYENLARMGKAVSSPARIEMLDVLAQGPRTVESLSLEIGQSVSNTSQHLQVLRRINMVRTERNGTYIAYALADDLVADFLRGLRLMGMSHLAEMQVTMERFLRDRTSLESLDSDELRRLMEEDSITVIDVRPRAEYLAGHLAGAISTPLSEIGTQMSALSENRDIAAYCRGPYCVMAMDAVEMLTRSGFRAFHVADGVADFRAKNFGIETDQPSGGDAAIQQGIPAR